MELSPDWKSRNCQGAPRNVQQPRKTGPLVSNHFCLPLRGKDFSQGLSQSGQLLPTGQPSLQDALGRVSVLKT